jgi:succinate dehydrogenase / fumarate reductase cytochrome b subunit
MTTTFVPKVPMAFIWRRLHSLAGLWFVLFLIEHLLTNSQAALWLGDNGQGFVRMVNALHNLPYLQVIEITLLGFPILLHIILGVRYLFTAQFNVTKGDGSKPYLPRGRNYAYTLQRITSWILLACLIVHVAKFRFWEYPHSAQRGGETLYWVKVEADTGLPSVADRLGIQLYDAETLPNFAEATLHPAQRLAVTPDFGTATLLTVRDTFKNPFYIAFYTLFVLAACFHAFNGFWTFLISWGWVLKMAAQRAWVTVSVVLMFLMLFLGLAAVWGTYWLNLRV